MSMTDNSNEPLKNRSLEDMRRELLKRQMENHVHAIPKNIPHTNVPIPPKDNSALQGALGSEPEPAPKPVMFPKPRFIRLTGGYSSDPMLVQISEIEVIWTGDGLTRLNIKSQNASDSKGIPVKENFEDIAAVLQTDIVEIDDDDGIPF